MARKSKKPASRGSVNNIILEVLSEGEKYGYEIIKEVEEKSNGKIILKQPSLYSSLTRFENKGYVSSYWKESSIGGRRHYYKLTELGAQTYYNLKHKDDVDNIDNNIDVVESDINDQNANEANVEVNYIEPTFEDNTESSNNESYFDLDSPQTEEDSYINSNDIFDNSSYYKLKNYNNFDVSKKLDEILNNNSSSDHEDIMQNDIEKINSSNSLNNELKASIESDLVFKDNVVELEETIETIKNEEVQKSLKTIYSNIKNFESENKQNNESLYNFYNEPITITPLTYLEQQKRKESLEILYGNNPGIILNEQESITQDEEQINFESYLELKKSLNEKKYLYKTNKRYTKKQKPFIIKQLYTKQKTLKNKEQIEDHKAKPKFTFDEFGIMKIETDSSTNSKPSNAIIDNVGYRSSESWHKTNYSNSSFSKTSNNQIELSQEQIEKKNNDFKEHFNKIAKEKYENHVVDELNEKNQNQEDSYKIIINNSVNNDSFIELDDEVENSPNIEIKSTPQLYENNSPNSNLTKYCIKTYGEANSYITDNKTNFIPINKIKFIFTLIFALLNVLLTTTILFLLKNYNLLQAKDILLYQVSYALTIILILFSIIPLILNKNKVVENSFNFTYSMMFCLILFIVSLLLNYAFNTLLGYNFTNIKSHISNFLVPAVWSVTIILSPVIYKLLIFSKTKYK